MLRLSGRLSPRRLDRACAKIDVVLQHADRREARTQERLGQAAFRLSRMACKAERQRAARLEHAMDLAQAADRIRPCLHGVDGERPVEGAVGERQMLDRAALQADPAMRNRLRVPGGGLLDHLHGLIDARDMTCRRLFGQQRDGHAGPKTDFEYVVALPYPELADHPGGAVAIGSRHDPAAQASKDAFGPAEHAHQNVACEAHRSLANMPQRLHGIQTPKAVFRPYGRLTRSPRPPYWARISRLRAPAPS